MGGRIKYSARVFIAVLTMCWMLVAIFLVFQYVREKEFRQQLLDNELQLNNTRIIGELRRGVPFPDAATGGNGPEGMRVTVVDSAGRVVYDSTGALDDNHNDRSEIVAARTRGTGTARVRRSHADGYEYFYSAKLADNGTVVRSAAPYTHSLEEFLAADSTLLWIMLAVSVAMAIPAYITARRLSVSIERLDSFARRAREGDKIFDDVSFPTDELGNIASNIVRLYVQRHESHSEALAAIHEKNRIKKQLTNNINHELKTPVAAIVACAELLEAHPDLPAAERTGFVSDIAANGRRLTLMLDDVGQLTRMDEGREMISMNDFDLTAAIVAVVNDERRRFPMDIACSLPPMRIHGNESLIASIFRNLITNAAKHSGATTLTVSADGKGKFTVADNGTGVPSEHLERIFERFYRVDKGRSRAAGGTGLGLAIVRNAIAIHGGTITATNDGGLRLDFTLPLL